MAFNVLLNLFPAKLSSMKAMSQPKLHAPVRHVQSLPLKPLSSCRPIYLRSFPLILPIYLEHVYLRVPICKVPLHAQSFV